MSYSVSPNRHGLSRKRQTSSRPSSPQRVRVISSDPTGGRQGVNRIFQHARVNPIAYLALFASTWLVGLALASNAQAGDLSVWVCGTWTRHAGVMHPIVGDGYGAGSVANCAKTGLALVTTGREHSGDKAAWQANAPKGLALVGAWVPPFDLSATGINDGRGEGGDFYWKGHGAPLGKATTWKSPRFTSPYFGWRIVCRLRSCLGKKHFASLLVFQIELKAQENRAPRSPRCPGPVFGLSVAGSWVNGQSFFAPRIRRESARPRPSWVAKRSTGRRRRQTAAHGTSALISHIRTGSTRRTSLPTGTAPSSRR